jgi:hypothetical protein
MAVTRVLHTLARFEVELVVLLKEFAALNVRLGTWVLEITAANHVDARIFADLHDLEIMRQHIARAFTVLGVLAVSRFVAEFVSSARACKQVENINFKSIIVQHVHLITNRGACQCNFTTSSLQILSDLGAIL